jgi:surfactin synthase thioesterase subunit
MTRWLAHMPEGNGPVLVCFPFAGGGASAFAAWRRALAPDLAVCAVQPPGREGRAAEDRFREYSAYREALIEALLPVLARRRVAFYGHSLGGWVAWDVARALSAAGTAPLGLIVGAQRAPSCPYPFRNASTMEDAELIGFLRRCDDRTDGLTGSITFIQWMLPLLRDDLRLCETHAATNAQVSFPICALSGRSDPLVSESDVSAWARHTRSDFRHSAIEGGHFFIRSHRSCVLDHVRRSVREWATDECFA